MSTIETIIKEGKATIIDVRSHGEFMGGMLQEVKTYLCKKFLIDQMNLNQLKTSFFVAHQVTAVGKQQLI